MKYNRSKVSWGFLGDDKWWGDMRDTYSRKSADLEKKLAKTSLTPEQKDLVQTAMEFGYSAAFCARTCDMNGNFSEAERYQAEYQSMRDLLIE